MSNKNNNSNKHIYSSKHIRLRENCINTNKNNNKKNKKIE